MRRSIRYIFFLFLHKNICCGYSLEAPQWGASNEYTQHMFPWRNKKNINVFCWTGWIILSYENTFYIFQPLCSAHTDTTHSFNKCMHIIFSLICTLLNYQADDIIGLLHSQLIFYVNLHRAVKLRYRRMWVYECLQIFHRGTIFTNISAITFIL